jgi:hypothetical protein
LLCYLFFFIFINNGTVFAFAQSLQRPSSCYSSPQSFIPIPKTLRSDDKPKTKVFTDPWEQLNRVAEILSLQTSDPSQPLLIDNTNFTNNNSTIIQHYIDTSRPNELTHKPQLPASEPPTPQVPELRTDDVNENVRHEHETRPVNNTSTYYEAKNDPTPNKTKESAVKSVLNPPAQEWRPTTDPASLIQTSFEQNKQMEEAPIPEPEEPNVSILLT